MATNVASVSSHFPKPQPGFTTTTSGAVSSGATTVGLNSTGDYSNGDIVALVIDPTDSDKKQVLVGTVDTGGVQLTGVVWTDGTNQSHASGATVVDMVTATHLQMLTKGILEHTNQDGTLKDLAVHSASVLASNVVTTPKILDSNVTTAKLANGSVTPVKWTNPYKFHAYRNAAWTGNSGKIDLDTEVFDSNGDFDATTNFRYDVPVDGFYQINFGAGSQQNSGTGYTVSVRKNGTTTIISGSQDIATQTTSFNTRSVGAGLVELSAGDYLELIFVGGGSPTGGTGASVTYMSGYLVSET